MIRPEYFSADGDPENIAKSVMAYLGYVSDRYEKPLSKVRSSARAVSRYACYTSGDVRHFASCVLAGEPAETELATKYGFQVDSEERDYIFSIGSDAATAIV